MSIQRIPTAVALPLNANNNEYYFDVSSQVGQIDHKSSYQELEINLYDATGAKVTDYSGVVFGQDGLLYNASALFRTSSLMESRSKKVYQNLSFVNILSNNLEYWTKGVNDVKSDALYNGYGASSSDGQILSVFNNNYQDLNPTVKIPMSVLYPGDLGVSEIFGQMEDLEYRYLLENQYPVFMRAVNANAYSSSSASLNSPKPFADADGGATTLTGQALGVVISANFAVDDYVLISYTDPSGNLKSQVRKLTAVVPDSPDPSPDGTKGTISFADALNAGDITTVTVQKYTYTAGTIAVISVTDASNLVVNWPVKKDLYANTMVVINYTDVSGNVQSVKNQIKAVTVTGTNITSVELETPLASANIYNVSITPLYTNLDDYSWSVLSANLVLYRRVTPLAMPESLLYSTFESKNVQCVAGLNKFSYTFKTPSNGYNTFLMMPNDENLYSQLPEYGSYKYTVNNKDLTQIYIPLKDNVLHKDNMIRALSNSLVYTPKNLSKFRDTDIVAEFNPEIVPAKIFHSEIKGQLNVQDMMNPDNDTLVEVFTQKGQSTSAKNVYLFVEKFVKV